MQTDDDRHQRLRTGLISGLLAVACWAGFVLVSRQGGLGVMMSWDVVALRFSIGSLILLVMAWRQVLWSWQGLALAMIGGLGYGLLVYEGFRHTSAVHAAVMLPGGIPFAAALFSYLLLGERLSVPRGIGLALIAAGIYIMFTASGLGLSFEGDLWLLGSVVAWSLYTVLARRWQVAPMAGAVTTAVGSALVFLPVYVIWLPKTVLQAPWPELVLQGVYQGVIASVLAMLLYLRAVVNIGPAAMGALMALVPVVSGLAAVPVLGETLSLLEFCALVATSFGAVLASGLVQRWRAPAIAAR